jgi:hypothetical protein
MTRLGSLQSTLVDTESLAFRRGFLKFIFGRRFVAFAGNRKRAFERKIQRVLTNTRNF